MRGAPRLEQHARAAARPDRSNRPRRPRAATARARARRPRSGVAARIDRHRADAPRMRARQLVRASRARGVRRRRRDERATRPARARAIMPSTSLSRMTREDERQRLGCRCPAGTTPAPRRRPDCARRRSAARPPSARRSHSSRAGHSHVGQAGDDRLGRRSWPTPRRPALEDRDGDRGVVELVRARRSASVSGGYVAIRSSSRARRRCGAPTSRRDLGDARARLPSRQRARSTTRHARLDDAGLLERDLRQRVPEMPLVIERDRRDGRDRRRQRRWSRRSGRPGRPRRRRRRPPRAERSRTRSRVVTSKNVGGARQRRPSARQPVDDVEHVAR